MTKSILYIIAIALCIVSDGLANEKAEKKLELPGIVADKGTREVSVEAISTGIAQGDPVEFVLINEQSGHKYEALAYTEAIPSDIKRALEFVGLQPGRPVDIDAMQFWPRGDAVDIRFEWQQEGKAESGTLQRVAVNDLLIDRRRDQKSFPTNGFLFVGAKMVEVPKAKGEEVLAADVYEPHSIISTYNDPGTLIDVGWRAPKGVEYGHIMASPRYELGEGKHLTVVISALEGVGKQEEADLTLLVNRDDRNGGESFTLESEREKVFREQTDLKGVLAELQRITKDGLRTHVEIVFGDRMTIDRIKKVCAFLRTVESRRGIRIEPPPEGQLYYKAYLPDKSMYERAERGLQPPELHLKMEDGDISFKIVKAERVWDDENSMQSDLQVKEWKVSGPAEAKNKLAEVGEEMPVLLVYAPGETQFQQIMEYVNPVHENYPTIFVLSE